MADSGDKPATPAVESPPRPAPDPRVQTSIVIGAGVLGANMAFFVLSMFYADERPQTDLVSVRLAFGVMSLVIGGTAVGAVFATRPVAHALAAGTACAEFVFGMLALRHWLPPVLGCALVIAGALGGWLVVMSWNGTRSAWAFAIALAVVLGVCMLFGAPKVRSQLGIGLWTALIYPGLKFVDAVALTALRERYRRSAA
jgi:hypothetical protein